jgi:hypothetical protein
MIFKDLKKKLMCAVGLHDWSRWYKYISNLKYPAKARYCKRCDYKQIKRGQL